MSLTKDIDSLYAKQQEHFLLPFIGESFVNPEPDKLRIAAIGINAYYMPEDEGKVDGMWFRNWWTNAGYGRDTHRFYNDAYHETDAMAEAICDSSLLRGLQYRSSARRKSHIYATNAIKYFTPVAYKQASAITPDMYSQGDAIWREELETLGRHNALPHLIICFGANFWELMWKSLDPGTAQKYSSFVVQEYTPCDDTNSPVYHRANRIEVAVAGSEQPILLVRLDHPATRSSQRRDAFWLLCQPEFRRLARLPD